MATYRDPYSTQGKPYCALTLLPLICFPGRTRLARIAAPLTKDAPPSRPSLVGLPHRLFALSTAQDFGGRNDGGYSSSYELSDEKMPSDKSLGLVSQWRRQDRGKMLSRTSSIALDVSVVAALAGWLKN